VVVRRQHGAVRDHPGRVAETYLRPDEIACRHRPQTVHGAHLGHEPVGIGACRRRGRELQAAAERDRLVHQAFAQRRDHEGPHVDRARGLPHHGHVPRVTAERTRVAVDEPERLDLVEGPEVARVAVRIAGVEAGHVEPPEDADPVVDGDHDGTGFPCQRPPVVHRVGRVPDHVAAAVDEHDDRQVLPPVGRAEHVQRQAVLGADGFLEAVADVEPVVRAARRRAEHPSFLDTAVAEPGRVTHTVPRPVCHRGVPAQVPDGWLGVRDAAPGQGSGPVDTLDEPEARAAHRG
jgi:hypothetical protein